MIQKILYLAAKKPKQLFLLDGLGALVSAFMLGIVLVHLQPLIGMPKNTLYFLAALPCGFLLFDIYSYFSASEYIGKFLRIIAMVNISYCLLSLGLSFFHRDSLTALGWIYFIVEIILVLLVALLEIQTAYRTSDRKE